MGYKNAEKIDLYTYFIQKRLYIEEILIKLNVYIFFDNELFHKDIEIWKKR